MATERVQLIVPTAINLLTAIHDSLLVRRRTGDTLEMSLPSLRRRAILVVQEIGVLPIQRYVEDTTTKFTR